MDAGLITLIIFLIIHLGTTVWWASKVNTQIDNFINLFDALFKEIKEIKINMFTQADAGFYRQLTKETNEVTNRRIERLEEKTENS